MVVHKWPRIRDRILRGPASNLKMRTFMSIPTPTTSAASSVPWLPLAVIGGIVLAAIAFTLIKKAGVTQAETEAVQLGAAVGFFPVANAATDTPPSDLASLKMLTHGRSHRFQHVMTSDEGGYVFQLNYDTGILHVPERWSYVVNVSPTTIGVGSVLVLSASGPAEVASELGYQDIDLSGHTLRTQDTAFAESLFASPSAQSWLHDHPEALVEIGGGYLAVMMPGEMTAGNAGENAGSLQKLLDARKKLGFAITPATDESE